MRALAAVLALALLALAAPPRAAHAHGMRTAYVEVTEIEPGKAIVRWRSPVTGAAVAVRFDAPCTVSRRDASPPDGSGLAVSGDGQAEHALAVDCGTSLAGARVRVDGLGPIVSEAVVWLGLSDGTAVSHLVSAGSPSWELPTSESPFVVAKQYVRLGVVHILTGADHLLFLLALVLCLRRARVVLLAETAFTLSHSLSFSAAALGWIHVSSRAAEACIALSLVLIARDIRAGEGGLPVKAYGPFVAFAFGLVHGLGFAGGLAEIGLPDHAIALALASFGAGVELGQVAFLLAVLGIVSLVARTRAYPRVVLAGAYVVGGVGSFWLIERLALCFQFLT